MKTLALFVSLSVLSGCYMSRVTAPGRAAPQEHADTGVSLFWGITRTDHGAIECQYGLKEVNSYFPWYSGFVQTITLGIVTPIKRTYTCVEPDLANTNIQINVNRPAVGAR